MDSRDEQALRAAKLYYESELSQAEVAAEIGVSRPTAAKLLQHARQRGFVTVEVHDPREMGGEVAQRLVEKFAYTGLVEVRVVQAARQREEELLRELGRMGAMVLSEHVQDGQLVGVSWGNTMYSVAKCLDHHAHRGVEIVQLKGGLSYTQSSTNDIETINLFCQAFDAFARTLPLPVIFDNVEAKRIVEQDRHIAHLLELGRRTDVVIFTVGATTKESLPLTMGYLSEKETETLVERAVGDACSRFFTRDGEIALPSVDERTVGITLDDLSTRPTRILVAGGREKAEAIETALRMGLATHLVVDSVVAAQILG
ncbi:sugar-binding transcriptional regulator [Corynebacterium testudinoris]|uniref:Transcriptional regulator with sigma factor-related N-terminal domain n=1 Tax=Corynebacterium testudinoris TaxID=136857 RepID=A0A0G3H6Z4_9CORY|nr:sugar-binding transcriptional regulator [Corynebacterium testudinoris]AKK09136.1 transcriptional regulator with sigma factor-related N-terminal domain [Corynebacterium testudinoris]MBX8996507.1 sugar-binding transcriptional regulator [Corynebacterium testudinoris]